MMKKLVLSVLPLLTCLMVGCKPGENVRPLVLSQSVLDIKVGDIAIIDVEGAVGDVMWTSSDESVATVVSGGVTAKAIGRAVITATSGNAKAECEVFVRGGDGATLRITPVIATLKVGDTIRFLCGNTLGFDIEWSSTNEEVATVDQNGLCTALKGGNAYVVVKTAAEEVSALVAVEHTWGEYQLVWSEEFNGTELDRSIWNVEVNGNGGGNNEKQYYCDRPENLRVKDGNLEIEVRKEAEKYNGTHDYTSGRINTRGKKDFTYGKIEARIKFPGGKGTWPAFWMLGSNMSTVGWPKCGEIDIIEHIGVLDSRASFALHTYQKNGSRGNNWASTHFFDEPLSADYHVYGVEWVEEAEYGRDKMIFYVDGQVWATAQEDEMENPLSWPFNKPEFIILNLAIGGNMGGSIDDNIFSQQRIMYVDWVRVYQREEKK